MGYATGDFSILFSSRFLRLCQEADRLRGCCNLGRAAEATIHRERICSIFQKSLNDWETPAISSIMEWGLPQRVDDVGIRTHGPDCNINQ